MGDVIPIILTASANSFLRRPPVFPNHNLSLIPYFSLTHRGLNCALWPASMQPSYSTVLLEKATTKYWPASKDWKEFLVSGSWADHMLAVYEE